MAKIELRNGLKMISLTDARIRFPMHYQVFSKYLDQMMYNFWYICSPLPQNSLHHIAATEKSHAKE